MAACVPLVWSVVTQSCLVFAKLIDICFLVHDAVGRILASAVKYEVIKDMRVKSVGTRTAVTRH